VTLKPRDLLVLYTDGITEAENQAGQDLARDQLLEWARQTPADSPKAVGEALLQRLQSFRGGGLGGCHQLYLRPSAEKPAESHLTVAQLQNAQILAGRRPPAAFPAC
jgi:hypothetical protein